MKAISMHTFLSRPGFSRVAAGLAILLVLGVLMVAQSRESAAQVAPVDLGTTESYSVLGGSAVTNTGPTILGRDLGVSPGPATSVTGFPPGIVLGTQHLNDAHAAQAQSDLVIAYNDAAGRAPTATVSGDLVGQTLTEGVYASSGPLALSGTLTLDAQGNPNAVFIFQIASTLITASASNVNLINGAQACNVFWQVGSSATLGTGSHFVGNILALTSITVTTNTTVDGRALARNGAVTLDSNVFTVSECDTSTPTPSPTLSPTMSPSPTLSPTMSPSPTLSPTMSPSPTLSPTMSPSPTLSPTMSPSPTLSPT
ncbi:ice-binding family protein, partial [Nonomuraea roseola]